jgi:large subunit ribosomal protein L21
MAINKFAVVKFKDQQYYAPEDGVIEVDKISGEKGTKVTFDEVLLLVDKDKIEVGMPLVKGAKVEAEILEQKRGEKVTTLTYKAKSRYRKKSGQRAYITVLKINKIG